MPKVDSDSLLKSGWGSAEASTSVRDKVSISNRLGRERRAWRAANFADLRAAFRGGDGYSSRERGNRDGDAEVDSFSSWSSSA